MKRTFIFLLFFSFLIFQNLYSKTIIVDDDAICGMMGCFSACEIASFPPPWNTYKTIKDALNNVSDGDTIRICPGSYNEDNLEIKNNSITIESTTNNPEDVIVYKNKNSIFKIDDSVSNVKIKGIKIEQQKSNKEAIEIDQGTGFIFENLIINSNGMGFDINKIHNSTIKNSIINTKEISININNSHNGLTIDNVTIFSSNNDGININKITGNFDVNNCDIQAPKGDAIWIKKCNYVRIENSHLHNTKYEAVYIKDNYENVDFIGNIIENPGNYGLYIKNSSNPGIIKNNIFRDADDYGLYLLKSKKWRGYIVTNNCFENGNNRNVHNRDRNANFNHNYYNDWDNNGSYEIPDIPVFDNNPLSSCQIGGSSTPIADWHFDKCIWNGTADEVKDNTTNHYDGTPKNGVNTTATEKVLCRSAFFDGINDYIEVKDLSNILKGTASLSFWIKTTQIGNNIDWKAPGIIGVEEYGGVDDIFWGWIDAHGHIGISKGDNYANSKSNTIINDGQWHHVVLSRNSLTGLVKIYIDGKLDKTGFTDSGIVGTPFSSIGRIENTNNSVPFKYFQGYLDEVKVFNYMLSLSDVQKIYNNEKNGNNWDGTNRECILCAKVDHYEIIHDSTGLTCLPESVVIKSCSNKECSTLYTNNVTLQLFPHGWVNGDTKSFSGGIATFKLQHKTKGTVTLGIVSSNPDADYCCRNSEIDNNCVNDMEHCNISFYDDGFIFDINNNYSCTTEQNIKIQAITKDSNDSCIPAFKNKSVSIHFSFNYINPSTGYVKPEINNKELNTDVVLNFNDNGTAEFNFKYNDAGEIGVTAIYDNATSYAKGYDSAIFSPKKFIFQGNNSSDNITDSDINPAYNSSCSNDTCWANINKFVKKAGEPFDFKIYAACSDGTITKNYKENVELVTQMEAPDKGDNVSIVNINKNKFNNGGVTVNNYVYNDVGIINLIAKHDNYSGSGLNIYGNIKIGRFIPDHFDVEFDNYTLKDNCSSGSFTYLGSKFYYKNTPKITIMAKNINGNPTLRYKNSFYKLPTSFYVHYFDNTSPAEFDNKTEVYDNDSKLYNINIYLKNDGFEYKKDVKTSEFEGNLVFKFESIEDSDGVKYGTNGIYTKILKDIHLRYGRFKIFDNYGSDTENLDMEVKVQYWDGDKWILNEDDSCTNVNKNDFYLTDSSVADITDLENISTGKWTITLSPKKTGQTSVCIKSSVSFYQYLIDNDSCGTSTFGIYRGRDRIILWKEIPSSQ